MSESYFKNGSQEEYMTVLPGSIWWSFMPAVASIVRKTKSVTYENYSEDGIRASRLTVSVAGKKPIMYPLFPPGIHWRLIEGLVIFTLILW